MSLAQFIVENPEPILREFQEFARTHTTVGETMDEAALRDHARSMLETIARDMEAPQSPSEEKSKSRGDAPDEGEVTLTAAEQHGSDRVESGFTLAEMFSEYRALRASVLRNWMNAREELPAQDLPDLIRFNEAIDQALAESITRYATGIEHSREMFLAILGHDLRSPLGAILAASSFLLSEGGLTGDTLTMASRIRSSSERMQALISDLLDLTRSRLGRGIPITRGDADLGRISREAVEEIAAHHPTSEIRYEESGDLLGQWDAMRVSQALSNLLGNAIQHGDPGSPVEVAVTGTEDEVRIEIRNRGPVIPDEDRRTIFDPFKSMGSPVASPGGLDNMGLGLYITDQIALAHGGSIAVDSSEEHGTIVVLRLPRV